jgi:hypothetical protein
LFDLGAGNDKGVSHWRPFQSLLDTDKGMEMLDLENRRNKLELVRCRLRKYLPIVLCPFENLRTDGLPLKFIENFTGRYQSLLLYKCIQTIPNAFEDARIKML